MAERITITDLRGQAKRLNERMGTPTKRTDNEGVSFNIGHFHIEQGSATYGRGWKLVQTTNALGGEHTWLHASTARELHGKIDALFTGLNMLRPQAEARPYCPTCGHATKHRD